MARRPLSDSQRKLGRALGAEVQRRRGDTPASSLALASGISLDAWRKLEQGAVPTPGFFLVADVARVLKVSLDELASQARGTAEQGEDA